MIQIFKITNTHITPIFPPLPEIPNQDKGGWIKIIRRKLWTRENGWSAGEKLENISVRVQKPAQRYGKKQYMPFLRDGGEQPDC